MIYLKDVPVHQYPKSMSIEECALDVMDRVCTYHEALHERLMYSTEILNEDSSIVLEGFTETVDKLIKRIWSVLTGLFRKFMDFVDEYIAGNKKFIKSNREYILKGYSYISDGINIGNWYVFKNLNNKSFYNIDSTLAIINTAKVSDNAFRTTDVNQTMGDMVSKLYSTMIKIDNPSDTDILKFFIGEANTDPIGKNDINITEVMESVLTAKNQIRTVKDSYSVIEKYLHQFQTSIIRTDHGNATQVTAFARNFSSAVMKVITSIEGAQLKALRMQLQQNKSICTKLASLGRSDTDSPAKETIGGASDKED